MGTQRPFFNCNVTGKGEILLDNDTSIGLQIIHLSAINALVVLDEKIDSGKKYKINLEFNSSIISEEISVDAVLVSNFTEGINYYTVIFDNLTESQKIAIDEYLIKNCTVSNKPDIQECSNDACIIKKAKGKSNS